MRWITEALWVAFTIAVFAVGFAPYCGCASVQPPRPRPDPVLPNATVYSCVTACEQLTVLGCVGTIASPGPDREWHTSDDLTCVEACEVYDGIGLPWDHACMTNAEDCGACQ